jgi:sugar O-acyltransferase (sialic acid O-acetyltransferase NeuD family)
MPTKSIAIIGAGGNAREIAGIIRDLGGYNFLGFLTDSSGKHDSPTLGTFDWLHANPVDCLAMGIGSPQAKLSVGRRLASAFPSIEWPVLIHPTAYVGPTCKLERGAIVCVRAVATEHVHVGEFAQLNFACMIGHEAIIGAGCIVNPGAGINGGVEIGEASMIGAGAQIIQYLKVGAHARVGAGAVVTHEVPDGATVKGVPARLAACAAVRRVRD